MVELGSVGEFLNHLLKTHKMNLKGLGEENTTHPKTELHILFDLSDIFYLG